LSNEYNTFKTDIPINIKLGIDCCRQSPNHHIHFKICIIFHIWTHTFFIHRCEYLCAQMFLTGKLGKWNWPTITNTHGYCFIDAKRLKNWNTFFSVRYSWVSINALLHKLGNMYIFFNNIFQNSTSWNDFGRACLLYDWNYHCRVKL